MSYSTGTGYGDISLGVRLANFLTDVYDTVTQSFSSGIYSWLTSKHHLFTPAGSAPTVTNELQIEAGTGITITDTAITNGHKLTISNTGPSFRANWNGLITLTLPYTTAVDGYLIIRNSAAITTEDVTITNSGYAAVGMYATFAIPSTADILFVPVAAGATIAKINDTGNLITVDYIPSM